MAFSRIVPFLTAWLVLMLFAKCIVGINEDMFQPQDNDDECPSDLSCSECINSFYCEFHIVADTRDESYHGICRTSSGTSWAWFVQHERTVATYEGCEDVASVVNRVASNFEDLTKSAIDSGSPATTESDAIQESGGDGHGSIFKDEKAGEENSVLFEADEEDLASGIQITLEPSESSEVVSNNSSPGSTHPLHDVTSAIVEKTVTNQNPETDQDQDSPATKVQTYDVTTQRPVTISPSKVQVGQKPVSLTPTPPPTAGSGYQVHGVVPIQSESIKPTTTATPTTTTFTTATTTPTMKPKIFPRQTTTMPVRPAPSARPSFQSQVPQTTTAIPKTSVEPPMTFTFLVPIQADGPISFKLPAGFNKFKRIDKLNATMLQVVAYLTADANMTVGELETVKLPDSMRYFKTIHHDPDWKYNRGGLKVTNIDEQKVASTVRTKPKAAVKVPDFETSKGVNSSTNTSDVHSGSSTQLNTTQDIPSTIMPQNSSDGVMDNIPVDANLQILTIVVAVLGIGFVILLALFIGWTIIMANRPPQVVQSLEMVPVDVSLGLHEVNLND